MMEAQQESIELAVPLHDEHKIEDKSHITPQDPKNPSIL